MSISNNKIDTTMTNQEIISCLSSFCANFYKEYKSLGITKEEFENILFSIITRGKHINNKKYQKVS